MTITESSVIAIRLELTQARSELERTRAAAESLGGGLGVVTGAASKMEAAHTAVAKKVETLRETSTRLRSEMNSTAGALGAVAQSFGQNDDAISSVIHGVSGLAAAYSSGGPLGVALAGTMLVVQQLDKVYAASLAAQDAALAERYRATEALIGRIKADAQTTSDLRERIATEGMSQNQLDLRDTDARVKAIDTEIAALQKLRAAKYNSELISRERAGLVSDSSIVGAEDEQLRLLAAQRGGLSSRRQDIEADVAAKKIAQRVGEQEDAYYEGLARRDAATKKRKQDEAWADDSWATVRWRKMQDDWARAEAANAAYLTRVQGRASDAAVIREAGEEASHERAAQRIRDLEELQKTADSDRLDRLKKQKDEEQAIAASIGGAVAGVALTSARIGVDVARASALVRRQLLVDALASEAVQVGGAIMLKGGEVVATGVASELLLPGNPLGIAQIAGGLALVGAGAAVQVGGPEAIRRISAQLPGGSPAAKPKRAARDDGVDVGSFGRRNADGGGSSVSITNIYGVAGPSAEDNARMMRDTVRRGRRRGIDING